MQTINWSFTKPRYLLSRRNKIVTFLTALQLVRTFCCTNLLEPKMLHLTCHWSIWRCCRRTWRCCRRSSSWQDLDLTLSFSLSLSFFAPGTTLCFVFVFVFVLCLFLCICLCLFLCLCVCCTWQGRASQRTETTIGRKSDSSPGSSLVHCKQEEWIFGRLFWETSLLPKASFQCAPETRLDRPGQNLKIQSRWGSLRQKHPCRQTGRWRTTRRVPFRACRPICLVGSYCVRQMEMSEHFLQIWSTLENVGFTVRLERDSPRLSKLAEAIWDIRYVSD